MPYFAGKGDSHDDQHEAKLAAAVRILSDDELRDLHARLSAQQLPEIEAVADESLRALATEVFAGHKPYELFEAEIWKESGRIDLFIAISRELDRRGISDEHEQTKGTAPVDKQQQPAELMARMRQMPQGSGHALQISTAKSVQRSYEEIRSGVEKHAIDTWDQGDSGPLDLGSCREDGHLDWTDYLRKIEKIPVISVQDLALAEGLDPEGLFLNVAEQLNGKEIRAGHVVTLCDREWTVVRLLSQMGSKTAEECFSRRDPLNGNAEEIDLCLFETFRVGPRIPS